MCLNIIKTNIGKCEILVFKYVYFVQNIKTTGYYIDVMGVQNKDISLK